MSTVSFHSLVVFVVLVSGFAPVHAATIVKDGEPAAVLVVPDDAGRTVEPAVKSKLDNGTRGGNRAGAEIVGRTIAARLLERGVKKVVFDRGGFLYHGRLKAVADAARAAGLEF